MKKISDIFAKIIFIFLTVILSWFVLLSICSTSYMCCDYSERMFYTGSSVWLPLLIISIIIGAFVLLIKKGIFLKIKQYFEENEKSFHIAKFCFLLFGLLWGIYWVIGTKATPVSDQWSVVEGVLQIRHGDYSPFDVFGYLHAFPQQNGLVLALLLAFKIIPEDGFSYIMILNVLMTIISINCLAKIGALFKMSRLGQLLTVILGVTYTPFIMFSVMIYGNVPSVMFATIAVVCELIWLNESKSWYAIGSLAAIVLAVFLKPNSLIILLAMCAYAFIIMLKEKRFKILLFIFIALISYKGQSVVTNQFIEKVVVHKEVKGGTSAWNYIAMGLHDECVRAIGWWDGSNDEIYFHNPEYVGGQAEEAKKDIKNSIKTYLKDPKRGIHWFIYKNASQWDEPALETLLISQAGATNENPKGIIKWLLSVQGSYTWANVLDIFQILMYFFSLVAFASSIKERKHDGIMLNSIAFLGGVLFHAMWETNSQYALSYMMFLVPLAIYGLTESFPDLVNNIKGISRKKIIIFTSSVLAVLAVIVILQMNGIDIIYLARDNAEYEAYRNMYTVFWTK